MGNGAEVPPPRALAPPVCSACALGPATGAPAAAAAALGAVGPGHSSSHASARQRLVPQAIGFGCAKDCAQPDPASTQAEGSRAGLAAMSVCSGGVAHGSPQMSLQIGKTVCGCEVRTTTRALVPGDECVLLLAGSGAGDLGVLGACRRGSGGVLAASGGSSSGGGSGSVRVGLRRDSASVGGRSRSLGAVACSCGPAGALGLADAIALATAVDADPRLQVGLWESKADWRAAA